MTIHVLEMGMGKSEDTRQAIIAKAAIIFNKNGYQRTSMSTLTSALGLTKGAIYGNFADKDTLAVEAFRYSVQSVVERLRQQLRSSFGPVGKLRAYAQAYMDFFDEMVMEGGCPVLNTAVDADDAHPMLHEEVRRVLSVWERSLISLVESGKEDGSIKIETDESSFASSFIALIEGGIFLAKTTGEKKHLECSVASINQLIDQMVAGTDDLR